MSFKADGGSYRGPYKYIEGFLRIANVYMGSLGLPSPYKKTYHLGTGFVRIVQLFLRAIVHSWENEILFRWR